SAPLHSRSCGWSWSSMPVAVPARHQPKLRIGTVAGGAGSWQRCRDMETLELLVGLLAAVAVVVRLAGRTAIPEPVLLVLAGLAVALIPGLATGEGGFRRVGRGTGHPRAGAAGPGRPGRGPDPGAAHRRAGPAADPGPVPA